MADETVNVSEIVFQITTMKTGDLLKPVSKVIKVDVPSQKVWEVISSPGNLELYHPFCESNPIDRWPGSYSVDYVNYYNGLQYQRLFTNWLEGRGYDLLIGKNDGKKSIWET